MQNPKGRVGIFRSLECTPIIKYDWQTWFHGQPKGGSRHKNWCMARFLSFLIRHFSNYYTLHRSDLAARATPLDPRLQQFQSLSKRDLKHLHTKYLKYEYGEKQIEILSIISMLIYLWLTLYLNISYQAQIQMGSPCSHITAMECEIITEMSL